MGSAVAKEDEGQKNKTIFIKLLNHVQWLTFSSKISTEDLNDRLTALCGQPRGATILLKDRYGARVAVSPAMRTNTLHDAFIVEMQADRLSVSALRKRAKQDKQGTGTDNGVPNT